MKNRPALAVLLFVALPLALARRVPAAPPGPAQVRPSGGSHGSPPDPFPPPSPFSLRQGMPSKSRPVPAPVPPPLPVPLTAGLSAGDMHDFFVGLMGKRAAEPGRAAGRGDGGPTPRCSPGPPAPGEAPLRAA
uniref:Uncharacterized protein n=1 Tax=Catharus ustulatus TaxID=91951 RepID=A0A8C3UHP9_CATUS